MAERNKVRDFLEHPVPGPAEVKGAYTADVNAKSSVCCEMVLLSLPSINQ